MNAVFCENKHVEYNVNSEARVAWFAPFLSSNVTVE